MSLYLYAPKWNPNVQALAVAVGARRLRRFDGIDFWDRTNRLAFNRDVIVCWGGAAAGIEGVTILNSSNKALTRHRQFQVLSGAGISVGQIVLPEGEHGVEAFVTAGYLPRVEGKSMLSVYQDVPTKADFYTQKQTYTNEYRVHVSGKTILAAGKQVAKGKVVTVKDWAPWRGFSHPFVKNIEGGWATDYAEPVPQDARDKVLLAVQVLGLSFAMVSVGQLSSGRNIIINVKSAPELDQTTLPLYTREILSAVRAL